MRKHVTAALLISPILAIIAYFGVDTLVREEPRLVRDGTHYNLNVKPNCRWDSGKCSLVNADIELSLTYSREVVRIDSNVPIDQLLVALAKNEDEQGTKPTKIKSPDGMVHYFDSGKLDPNWFIQLSASIDGGWFHAPVPLKFTAKNSPN